MPIIFESMKNTLQKGEEIFIGHFVRFEIKERKERRYRNPVTKEMGTIPPSQTVTFKPSGELLQSSHKDNRENTVKLTP